MWMHSSDVSPTDVLRTPQPVLSLSRCLARSQFLSLTPSLASPHFLSLLLFHHRSRSCSRSFPFISLRPNLIQGSRSQSLSPLCLCVCVSLSLSLCLSLRCSPSNVGFSAVCFFGLAERHGSYMPLLVYFGLLSFFKHLLLYIGM